VQSPWRTVKQHDHQAIVIGGTAWHEYLLNRILRPGLRACRKTLDRGSGAVQKEEIVVVRARAQRIGPLQYIVVKWRPVHQPVEVLRAADRSKVMEESDAAFEST